MFFQSILENIPHSAMSLHANNITLHIFCATTSKNARIHGLKGITLYWAIPYNRWMLPILFNRAVHFVSSACIEIVHRILLLLAFIDIRSYFQVIKKGFFLNFIWNTIEFRSRLEILITMFVCNVRYPILIERLTDVLGILSLSNKAIPILE